MGAGGTKSGGQCPTCHEQTGTCAPRATVLQPDWCRLTSLHLWPDDPFHLYRSVLQFLALGCRLINSGSITSKATLRAAFSNYRRPILGPCGVVRDPEGHVGDELQYDFIAQGYLPARRDLV